MRSELLFDASCSITARASAAAKRAQRAKRSAGSACYAAPNLTTVRSYLPEANRCDVQGS